MEEIKYCQNKMPQRECAVVHISHEHKLPIFSEIEVDETILFLAADTVRETLTDIKNELLQPPDLLSSMLGVIRVSSDKIPQLKELFNTTTEDFLSGHMESYQKMGLQCLFGFRYLQNKDALIFMCNNSVIPQRKHTLLDTLNSLSQTLQKKGIIGPDNLLIVSASHTPFAEILPVVCFLSSGPNEHLVEELAQDQVERDLVKKINAEKNVLLSEINTKMPQENSLSTPAEKSKTHKI